MVEEHLYRLTEYFRTGGTMMPPLLSVSLLMWVLIANRVIFLRRLARKNMDNTMALQYICDNRMPKPGEGGVVGILVARFVEQRSGDRQLDRYILDEAVLSLNRSLGHFLPLIGSLAAVAPLIGLLGTVTGMMMTFEVLSIFGTGNAKGMAVGISEALITTETGLVIAIPGLYMKNFLERRAQGLGQQLTVAGYYLRRHLREMSC